MFGLLRRRLLTPSLRSVSFAGRGFPVTPTPATERLESVPRAVICGFEWGIDAPSLWELERRLALVEPEQRGFAYEGATMACTVLDVMPGGRRDRTAELLTGPGAQHIFLAYIGIGFAMARLPRPLWKKVLPDLTGSPYHPTMSWLAVDGYGFDLAYFHTGRWVDGQEEPRPYPWLGREDYFPRAVDQGIGRALWFIHGGDPVAVADAVDRFAERRRPDLWSGVGLAATFAGGCDRTGLTTLRRRAGEHHAELALGTVFAAKARTYASFVPPHTRRAAAVLADLTVDAARELADGTAVAPDERGPQPAYEQWRERIRRHFTAGAVQAAA
ncbi:DUF1702 family protein [Amycolatopsis suaedae]|uniref:DUF1702 family protein n=1 Tax=Amycolatopsis suaedae TaxID=2510978 RepID=A0A4Q7J2Y7_9PSEU|nr:DUF1702 family protein [Amycolatopsis suaedae]RZQ61138.1 DUF1702 family protein [Amycolatopsis suaedae]